MATAGRTVRPRPLDINKQLQIVRDINELDSTDGLPGGTPAPQPAAAAGDDKQQVGEPPDLVI